VSLRERRAESGATLFSETPAQITSLRPIESLLSAEVTVYETLRDWRYGYFRIEIRRIGPEALPVLPKDVLLVQDCSASMAEQRLYFCRQGLARCLEQIGPQDRFAVVGFRDKVEKCFDGWAENNATNRARASAFIGGMVSAGETDIFGSIQSLLDIKGSTRRPVVAVMVSDGQPTAGVVDSSDIIGKFSKLNDGAISVFAMGTVQTANAYLLDLLSYCNGGESLVVTKGRWDIPDSLAGLASQTARPVLNAVRFRFAEGGGCEVYPASTGNLYLDRPMALTGRYVRGTPGVVFQAVGRGLKADCDMIFNLDLSKARRTDDRGLRETWASQKIYHLIGQHARTGDPKTLEEIRATARAYGLRVPYRGEF
jgi:hypothetical protein